MKLTELEPFFLTKDGRNVALMFRCPHCWPANKQWLCAFFEPARTFPKDEATGDPGDRVLMRDAFIARGMTPEQADSEAWGAVSSKPSIAWKRATDKLHKISITPSIDASESGHWHGHITNGEIR